MKRITGQRKKVGHGGTMDPLACGVLPVCFGQATRLMDYVVGGAKRYLMDVKLGETTTTYDSEGEITATRSIDGITRADIEAALEPFIGVIDQVPPMYSAVKVDGQRLYKLARKGIEVEREARSVEIHGIRLTRAGVAQPGAWMWNAGGRRLYADAGPRFGRGAGLRGLCRGPGAP